MRANASHEKLALSCRIALVAWWHQLRFETPFSRVAFPVLIHRYYFLKTVLSLISLHAQESLAKDTSFLI